MRLAQAQTAGKWRIRKSDSGLTHSTPCALCHSLSVLPRKPVIVLWVVCPQSLVNFTEPGTMPGVVEERMTKSLSAGRGIRQVH